MELTEIQQRNYDATVRRGYISEYTKFGQFTDKIQEELDELIESYDPPTVGEIGVMFDKYELADIIITCLSMAKFYNIDIQSALEQKTIINEKRND